jgi:hypothetical protein
MATLPTFFRKTDGSTQPYAPKPEIARDPFQLRALPLEDVFFESKNIDNTRLVREADPRAAGRCWSAIGAACLSLALCGAGMAPRLANRIEGYKLEELRAAERQLMDQSRALQLREAELLSPGKLEQLARERNLALPSPGQVVNLEPKNEGAMAMAKQ